MQLGRMQRRQASLSASRMMQTPDYVGGMQQMQLDHVACLLEDIAKHDTDSICGRTLCTHILKPNFMLTNMSLCCEYYLYHSFSLLYCSEFDFHYYSCMRHMQMFDRNKAPIPSVLIVPAMGDTAMTRQRQKHPYTIYSSAQSIA